MTIFLTEAPALKLASSEELELKHMLELLRIKASTHILNWVPGNGQTGNGTG